MNEHTLAEETSYEPDEISKGKRLGSRLAIAKLARVSRTDLVSVAAAAEALNTSRRDASLRLASLARAGWLERIRRGLYLVRPLETEPHRPSVPEDPWVLAREVYSPCYIGGWSAAEHWGLTSQIFRSTLVITAAPVRSKTERLLGQEFRLFHVSANRIKGTTLVWRGTERVAVSDRERTIVDCLRHPDLCGGIRHLVDIFQEYRSSDALNVDHLLATAEEAANGAAWKRLGYLAEALWPDYEAITERALGNLTAGNVKLDPSVKRRGKLSNRWRLWLNVEVHRGQG